VKRRLARVTLLLIWAASSSPAQARFPGREAAKPLSEVRDSFLGYFVGLVDSNALGFADSGYLHEVLPEFTAFLSLPFEDILRVSRRQGEDGILVSVDFRSEVRIPIPFRVLWDTPGAISAGRFIAYRETRLQEVVLSEDGSGQVLLSPVYVFDRVAGDFFIDFDPWIDVLLGRAVDDVHITRVLLFRYGKTWYGGLMGKGYEDQLVVGYFDLTSNRILVPVPRRLRALSSRFGG
jgi:hypothetical protein